MSDALKCSVCGKPQDPKFKPFCSKRCADVDLGRWFSGRYAIPAEEQDNSDEPPPPGPREGEDP